MSITTPHDYMNLYRGLPVPVFDAAENFVRWQKIDIHKYLLSNKDSGPDEPEHFNINNAVNGLGVLNSKINDHFHHGNQTLRVTVGLSERIDREFRSPREAAYYAGKAFWGKACPEELQITLQLAVRFGLTDLAGLQGYCDQRTSDLAQGKVGLDCNGFVGNYLQHGLNRVDWDDNKPGFGDYPANNGIRDIMQTLGPEVKTIGEINILKTYVLGMVNPVTTQVINRIEGRHVGHIMITTPWSRPTLIGRRFAWMLRVVESTIDVGLTESDYILTDVGPYVFNAERGSRPVGDGSRNILVRLRPIN